MKKLIFIFCLFLSIGLQAQTVSISCETCQWLKSSDCDVCSSVYKSKMFRGGLKIKKLGKTMYFEHPLSIELVNSKFKMTDANGQKFDFYLNETSFNTIGALKSFIALCACSAPSDTSTVPPIVDTDRRLTELAFVGDSLVATIRDINNNIAAVIVLDNAKGTTTPCRDSVWKVVDTIFHKNVFCNIQKITMSSSKTNGFFQLTTLADTSLYTTQAQTQCPSPSFAKLDSCNISYLFIYDCNASKWELFKTPNLKTESRTLYVDRQLGNNATAKEGCPTCQFEYPEDAIAYAVANNIENPSIHVTADTFTWGLNGRTYPSNLGIFNKTGGTLTVLQDKAGVFRVNSVGTPFRFLSNLNSATNYYFDLGTIINDGLTTGTHDWYLSGSSPGLLDEQGSFTLKCREMLYNHSNITTPNTGFLGTIAQPRSKKILIECDNIETDVPGFVIDGGYDGNITLNINNYTQTNARAGGGYNSFIYVRGARINSNISFYCKNLQNKIYYGAPILLDFNIYPAIGQSQLVAENYKVKGYIDNYVRTDKSNYYPFKKGLGNFDSFTTDGFIEFWNRNGIPSTSTNIDYFIEANNVEEFYPIVNNVTNNSGMTLIDSKIHIKINNGKSKSTCISLSGWTLVNTQILIEGDFTSDSTKCVSLFQNNIDSKSSITLKGKFKTTSPTLEAMEIGNNSGTGVDNIYINGQIITGGGYSIDNPLGTPVNVKVLPGCASNVTTSANVTQLGAGIYVDPNFNN